jgi:hypothetical protein
MVVEFSYGGGLVVVPVVLLVFGCGRLSVAGSQKRWLLPPGAPLGVPLLLWVLGRLGAP